MSAEERISWIKEYADPYFYPLLDKKLITGIKIALLRHSKGLKNDIYYLDFDGKLDYILRGFIIVKNSYEFPAICPDCRHIQNRVCICKNNNVIQVFKKPNYRYTEEDKKLFEFYKKIRFDRNPIFADMIPIQQLLWHRESGLSD